MRTAGLHHAPLPARLRRRGGFTLVELMVSITISLVLVLAATAMYLATRESQRNIDQASAANEAGGYALRTIGRELMNAAFYPAVRTESVAQANVLTSYTNPTTVAAYNVGVFGCEGAKFNPGTGACDATVAGAPDSLVVSYFTNDAFGTSVGQRADCTGNDVGTATINLGRVGAGGSLPPSQPLFVANHYALEDTTMSVEGRAVSTRSLACNGNGSGSILYQQLLSGIDNLQLSYAVFNDPTRTPSRYYTANQINALANATIDGEVLTPWARVIAVRVCVIARTYESAASISAGRYENCAGTLQAGDGTLRKTYVQVFGLRNRQSATY